MTLCSCVRNKISDSLLENFKRVKCVFNITGGGGSFISSFLTTPGISSVLLEIVVPYSNLASPTYLLPQQKKTETSLCESVKSSARTITFTSRLEESTAYIKTDGHVKYCSAGFSQALALRAINRCVFLNSASCKSGHFPIDSQQWVSSNIGVGITCSLQTNGKKGTHIVYLTYIKSSSVDTEKNKEIYSSGFFSMNTFVLTFKSKTNTRQDEDQLLSSVAAHLLENIITEKNNKLQLCKELEGFSPQISFSLSEWINSEKCQIPLDNAPLKNTYTNKELKNLNIELHNDQLLCEFLAGSYSALLYGKNKTCLPLLLDNQQDNIFNEEFLFFPGSFNPLHIGHMKLVKAALNEVKISGKKVIFEISISNPDKGFLPPYDVIYRVTQFLNHTGLTDDVSQLLTTLNWGLLVTRKSLFQEKVKLITYQRTEPIHILLGYDTYERLIDQKYYGKPMVHTISTFLQRSCRFIVGARKLSNSNYPRSKEALEPQTPWPIEMFTYLKDFDVPISSTDIRNTKSLAQNIE